jgi:hypothetical protein
MTLVTAPYAVQNGTLSPMKGGSASWAVPAPHVNDHQSFRPYIVTNAIQYLDMAEQVTWQQQNLTAESDLMVDSRPPPKPKPSPFPPAYQYPPETVDIILQAHFHTEDGLAWARRVGFCESTWNINAVGALGEIGWFQHRPEFWAERSTKAGYPGGDIWNPEINTAVAAWMYYSPNYGPSHWSCK